MTVEELFRRGVELQTEGKFEEASAVFHHVLDADPGQPAAYHALGAIAFQARNYADAVEWLKKAAEGLPDFAPTHRDLGVALLAAGRAEEAVGALEAAARLELDSTETMAQLARALQACGRLEDAQDKLVEAIEQDPHDPQILNHLGVLLQLRGQMEGAAACFAHAAQVEPEFADAHNNLGVVLHELNKPLEAIKAFEQSLQSRPEHAETLLNLGIAQTSAEQYDDAIVSFSQALRARPDWAEAQLFLGHAWRLDDMMDQAAACYSKALELEPGNAKARYYLSVATGLAQPAAMPAELVSDLFDRYAERFDHHLETNLDYRGPEELRALLEEKGMKGPLDILDLGCGTGLMGVQLAPFAATLVGVDLSARMVAKAGQRGVYTETRVQDVCEALSAEEGRYDLVAAADVFVYIGDLEPVFKACASGLRPGGCFAFSTESADEGDYRLTTHARYQHGVEYVREVASRHGFRETAHRNVQLRKEVGEPVMADLFCFQAGTQG